MPAPFDIDSTSPGDSDLINGFPTNERSNRSVIEDWLSTISDPATGKIRESALPPAGSGPIPSGTKMVFFQAAAPTGWTQDISQNNKAIRVVNGTGGTTGGTTAFTSVFTSRTPTGTNAATTQTGTIGNTTATGTVNNTTSTGSVGDTALNGSQIPNHTHSFSATTSSDGDHTHTYGPVTGATPTSGSTNQVQGANTGGSNKNTGNAGTHSHTVSGTTGGSGSGAAHGHSLTMNAHNHSFSGVAHNHTFTGDSHNHTWTGAAMDFAVAYIDVIIATKN